MNGFRLSVIGKKVIALVLCIGALPFVNIARAEELTYNAQARVQAAYLWRGLYAGGPNIQASANVGYYGVYADMWWNIGASDIAFHAFQPEVDFTLGFNRWGLDVFLLYIHNFNCGFFDGGNYIDKGNRLEMNVRYTIPKTRLTLAWATRVAASDAYLNAAGELVRAYSSYAEIRYSQPLQDGWSLYGTIGITPWKGCYNPNGAALQNIEFSIRKNWNIAERCGMMAQAQLCVNPMAQLNVIHLNATLGVYLR